MHGYRTNVWWYPHPNRTSFAYMAANEEMALIGVDAEGRWLYMTAEKNVYRKPLEEGGKWEQLMVSVEPKK